jgi:hypothetical protein
MSAYHTGSFKMAYLTAVEAAYAAGKGAATKYLCTPLAVGDAASVTAMNAMIGGGTFGQTEFERTEARIPGTGANAVMVWLKGLKYKEFSVKCAIQNTKWINAVIAPTAGVIPTSYMFHIEWLGSAWDICGCIITGYDYDDSGDFPIETLTFCFYDVITSVILTGAGCPDPDLTQPKIKKNFSATYHALALAQASSIKFKIKNDVEEEEHKSGVAGKYQRMDPYMISRSFTCDVEALVDTTDGLITHPRTEATEFYDLIITGWGGSLTVTNTHVKATNLGEIPEFGHFKYKFTFAQGNAAITYA